MPGGDRQLRTLGLGEKVGGSQGDLGVSERPGPLVGRCPGGKGDEMISWGQTPASQRGEI